MPIRFAPLALLALLVSPLAVTLFAQDDGSTPPAPIRYEEMNGLLCVEAENFARQEKDDVRRWYLTTAGNVPEFDDDADGPHHESASGGAYLEILPDTRQTHSDPLVNGVSFSNTAGVLAFLHYDVYINNPGRYYIWVRAYSTGSEDNGIHVGLNGQWPSSGQRMQWCQGKNQWTWDSKQRTSDNHCGEPYQIYLDIDEPGEHTISFSMREDGFEFDKWFAVRDRVPMQRVGSEGPPESPAFTGTARPQAWFTDIGYLVLPWRQDPDLGRFNSDEWPWLTHQYLDRIYDASPSRDQIWWWHEQTAWMFTTPEYFPLVYSTGFASWLWLQLKSNSASPVYIFAREDWTFLDFYDREG